AIKKTFKIIELGYKSMHACANDCFLFWGDANKDVHFCRVCNTSRWKYNNTPGKKVPKKVLRYFPIIPRLQRVYKSSHTAKEMTWHATGKCMEPGKMQHPIDGRAWKDFELRNVRLGLAADGFNPFGNLSQSYSISFMLTLLIPGPKSPGKNIDVYLRPLIDDLKDLWAKPGVETIDVAIGLKFNMRAMVLWTINDFPARSSLSGWSSHKRFLKKPHKWRRSLEFIGETEDGDPPREFRRDAIMTQLARLPMRVKGKHPRFGSNFKHKVTDNDTNITGLKSHDCHIMMQRLLPYGLQQYLPPDVAKPLIELCLFFKQICSQTLMVDDMLKAQSKVIDILCNLELIYPPAFFDIMIHLVIHLPLEAIFGGPIRPRWMYPFERYMKKLKNYVRNKAKPEGSIAEGYVAEEALTFSSHYFRDVTTKFNHPDRNVDFPPLTCQFQVFKSLCKSIGLRSVIRIDHQELKKVIWYVLHNSPEIDTYRAKFKSEFPENDMKEAFPDWFGKQSYSGFDTSNKGRMKNLVIRNNITQIKANGEAFKNDQYILATQVKQCFYLEDMSRRPLGWKVVEHVSHKKFSIGGVIVVEDDPDVIHVDNSSDLALSTSLNDLEIAALHIDGQSIDVDAPPDIIDVVDEDDDIIDEEDPIPHDLADSDDEDLVNLDIDDGMSADVARGHGGDGGGDDRPPSHQIPTGCGGCLGNRGHPKTNLSGRRADSSIPAGGPETGLKAITDKSGPVTIRFEFGDRDTLMPLGEHAAHWANYLGEIVREMPLHYPSWRQVPPEQKAGVMARIGTQFDMRWIPTDWTYDLERHLGLSRLSLIYEVNWVALIGFGMIQEPMPGLPQNKQNRAKDKVMESSATREYPSLIHTFFLTHTVNGVFLNSEDKALYDEMLRIGHGHSTPASHARNSLTSLSQKEREVDIGLVNMFMNYLGVTTKFSQRLKQLSHRPGLGGGNGSGEAPGMYELRVMMRTTAKTGG
ncbi:hypothetical protein Tco_1151401, partial [Tanacetum coccineum]